MFRGIAPLPNLILIPKSLAGFSVLSVSFLQFLGNRFDLKKYDFMTLNRSHLTRYKQMVTVRSCLFGQVKQAQLSVFREPLRYRKLLSSRFLVFRERLTSVAQFLKLKNFLASFAPFSETSEKICSSIFRTKKTFKLLLLYFQNSLVAQLAF